MCSVSVIIPVYNDEIYLWEAIESVYRQEIIGMEVIAVNDGSTDNSLEILQCIKNKYPSLIILSQENRGPGAARNRGLKEARGEYIYFLDGDDVIEPNLVATCLKYIKEKHCDIVSFEADIFGNIDNKDKKQYIYDYRCKNMDSVIGGIDFFINNYKKIAMLNTPLLFFRKSFLATTGLLFMETVLYEDMLFYYEMITLNPSIYMMSKVLYHRRYRDNSIMTSGENEKKLRDRIIVYIAIGNMGKCQLRKIYYYHSLKEIRKSIEKLYQLDFALDHKILNNVKNYLNKVQMRSFELDFLGLCEFYLCCKYINDDIAYARLIIKNRVKTINCINHLYTAQNRIGIYGTGQLCDLFHDICTEVMGEFTAEIVYIDTFVQTEQKTYRGSQVVNYKEVDYKDLAAVIVTSEAYEDSIYDNIRSVDQYILIYVLSNL